MVAEKTPKLQDDPFFKGHRGTIPDIACENEISNKCLFSKAKKDNKRKYGNFMPLVDVYYACVTCLSLNVIGFCTDTRLSIDVDCF